MSMREAVLSLVCYAVTSTRERFPHPSCPSPVAALGRADPATYLDSTVELAPDVEIAGELVLRA